MLTLDGNQQDQGFPSTKQDGVITTTDPNSECPLEGIGKQTVIDLAGPSSSRSGTSQGGYSCFM